MMVLMLSMLVLDVKQNKRGKFIKVEKTSCHDVVVAIDVDLDDGVDVVAGLEAEQERQVHQGKEDSVP